MKDIIIIRGRNFYPQDIEWVVSESRACGAATSSRSASTSTGEEQLVVCAEAFQSDAAGLTEAIAAGRGRAVRADRVTRSRSFRRAASGTSSGKPQRRKTKQMFLDGTLGRPRDTNGT